jgi:hypothetical protein
MEDEIVGFKTATLAYDKGFRKDIDNHYSNISAPTQSVLQKWLREKHNIFVICTQEFYWDGVNHLVQVFKYNPEKERCYEGTMLYGDNGEFESYEVSLEFGLKLALELI